MELVGVYLGPTVAVVMFAFGFLVLYFLADLFTATPSSYQGAGRFVIGGLSQQPVLIAAVMLEVVASIFITKAAIRNRAWAHWGAVALIAVSTVPPIVVAMWFQYADTPWQILAWLIAGLYCAGSVAFIVAMTSAFLKHGPWGIGDR